MNPPTALGAALRNRSADKVTAAELAMTAYDALRGAGLSVEIATPGFADTLRGNAELLAACAAAYLRDRAAEMRGQSLIGTVQTELGAQTLFDRPGQSQEGAEGLSGCAAPYLSAITSLPSAPSPTAGRESQASDAQARRALPSQPAPIRDDRDQTRDFPQTGYAPVVAKPQRAPRTPEAAAAVQAVLSRSILDTYRVRDGRAVGDLPWRDLTALALTNEREAQVLRRIHAHIANARPGDLVRDVVSAATVEAAIAEAGEADDVAA